MSSNEAVSLLVISLGAFAIPLVSGRLKIPAAVGEILYGAVLGPYALGLVESSSFIEFLADLGFAFLMFLAGLELDFIHIERRGGKSILGASLAAAAISVVSLGVTLLAGFPPFLFLAFGAVSVGILLAALNETGASRTGAGQLIILIGSIGEFITIILLTMMGIFYKHGGGTVLAIHAVKLGAIFVAALVVLLVLRTLLWWYPSGFARLVRAKDPAEIGVRAATATMFVFVAFASLMGVKAILGAFVAGALFSFVFRDKEVLEGKMSSIGFGFFVPVFFIWVGAEFDIANALTLKAAPVIGIFLLLSLVSKLVPSLGLVLSGLSLRNSIAAGFLLSAPLTLLVVVARIGEESGALDGETASALVALAIVSSILFPWLFGLLFRKEDPEEA